MTRAILVGAGGFGQVWADVLQKLPEWELAAVVDLDREAAARVGATYGVASYESLEVAAKETNAVVAICVVPPAAHKAVALMAFQLGLDVITEKPLADNLAPAREMIAAARATGRRLVVSQNYRWRPHIQAIKNALAQGAIGEIGYIEWHFRKATELDGWRDEYDEILLEDMSIHHMDLIRYLTGRNAELVTTTSLRPAWSWVRGRPVASVHIRLEGGIHVSYFGSWVDWGRETPWDGECRIVGARGAIEMANNVPLLYRAGQQQPEPLPLPAMVHMDQAYTLEEFRHAVAEGRPHATDATDNVHSLALVMSAVRSAKTGEATSVER